jgi:hypothetical protein
MRNIILSLLALFALVLASPALADVSPAPDTQCPCDKAAKPPKDCPHHKGGKCDHAKCKDCAKKDCPHAKAGQPCDCPKCKKPGK